MIFFVVYTFLIVAAYALGLFIGSYFDKPLLVRYRRDMKKPKSERGREIAEQRRSSAAGIHGKHRQDRRNVKRRAIEQSRRDS